MRLVERSNTSLKEFFQLNNVRHLMGHKAKVHFNFVVLAYNCIKQVSYRLSRQLKEQAS